MRVLSAAFPFVVCVYFGFVAGKYKGFQEGVDSVEFDKYQASQKIRQCFRMIKL